MKTEDILQTTKKILELVGFQCLSVSGEYDNSLNLYVCNVTVEDSPLVTVDVITSVHHLVGRMLYAQDDTTVPSFVVDINNIQRNQIEKIKMQADVLMERAKSFGLSVPFLPMSAYERLLVHTYVASHDNFTTESEGEGVERHIVVSYNQKTL
jgi:predicted RNA-binding protein Jag